MDILSNKIVHAVFGDHRMTQQHFASMEKLAVDKRCPHFVPTSTAAVWKSGEVFS
jgi:hypothetical protein